MITMWPPPNVHYNENRFGECIISIPIETVSKITIGSSSSACLCLMAQHIMYLVGSTKIYKINDFSAHFARAEFAIFVQCYNFGVQGFFFSSLEEKSPANLLGLERQPTPNTTIKQHTFNPQSPNCLRGVRRRAKYQRRRVRRRSCGNLRGVAARHRDELVRAAAQQRDKLATAACKGNHRLLTL
jgi:hypothetical protein